MSQRIPLNQNRRVTGTTEILELCKDMLRLEHGIGNDFDMDAAEFTEFREQFLADFAQIPLIIGIDGRSGTGKTSLAAQLEQELTAAGHSVHVLHLDDFYPGWDGLFDGVEAWDALSVQLTEGIAGTYTPWDWEAGAPGEVRTVDPAATQVIICEGVGAIAGACEVRILVTAPDEVRYERAMARDGDTFRPHWERWAAQEEALLTEIPEDYATVDFIYDSAAQ